MTAQMIPPTLSSTGRAPGWQRTHVPGLGQRLGDVLGGPRIP
ncbi:MAG TPA: hypothetical protein VF843_03690 [Streptosporangiaceae bacterium]